MWCSTSMRMLALLTAVIAMVWLGGCGGQVSESWLEREIVARAPEYIAPAERYHAEVQGVSARRVASIRLVGYGVHPEDDLVIDPLELVLNDVRYSSPTFHVEQVGSATFRGRISEAALNAFVRQQAHAAAANVGNVRVELLPGQVRVNATVSAANLVDVPVSTTGELRVDDGLRLLYVPTHLLIGDIPIPQIVQGLLAARVNPLVDLSGLRFSPRITNVSIDRGEVIFSGAATLRDITETRTNR